MKEVVKTLNLTKFIHFQQSVRTLTPSFTRKTSNNSIYQSKHIITAANYQNPFESSHYRQHKRDRHKNSLDKQTWNCKTGYSTIKSEFCIIMSCKIAILILKENKNFLRNWTWAGLLEWNLRYRDEWVPTGPPMYKLPTLVFSLKSLPTCFCKAIQQ